LNHLPKFQESVIVNKVCIEPSGYESKLVTKTTDAISKKMDEINQELEEIKIQVMQTYTSNDTLIDSLDATERKAKKMEQQQHDHLDLGRFDAIPSSIKAYIKEEIDLLESRIPILIEQHLDKIMDQKVQSYLGKYNKGVLNLQSRPPWVNPNTNEKSNVTKVKSKPSAIAQEEKTQEVLNQLRKNLSKNADGTISSRLKNVRYKA
jgi:hypothetical protein